MKTLTFTHPNDLSQLHDELLAAVPALAGTWTEHVEILNEDGTVRVQADVDQPNLRVEGDGDSIMLTVPDDADEKAIASVVEAHAPEPRLEPPTVEQKVVAALQGLPDNATLKQTRQALVDALQAAPSGA